MSSRGEPKIYATVRLKSEGFAVLAFYDSEDHEYGGLARHAYNHAARDAAELNRVEGQLAYAVFSARKTAKGTYVVFCDAR